ncbi:MAG TPA: hypothetical protein VMV10_18330 [Pirellulales bacterium]|nr:hypothetical protein [Pirellulales bacterium]
MAELKEDRERLHGQIDALHRVNNELRSELAEIGSQYRALKEAVRSATANGTQAAIEVVIGGAAISAGSAFPSSVVKWCFIVAGLVGVIQGSALSIRTNRSAVPPDQRDKST